MSTPRAEQVDVIPEIRKRLDRSVNSIGMLHGASSQDELKEAARSAAGLARTLASACDELADTLARE